MALIPGIRKKLKIERLVAHMIVALGLVFLPIALEEILLGITQSFKTWSYPMLVNTHAFYSFASRMESSGTMMQPTAFGVSAISMDTLNHPELLGFVSTGSVNLWITLILALLVIWIVLLNHIVSKAISNNLYRIACSNRNCRRTNRIGL